MASTALKQITSKAKSLQRSNKKLAWKDAIKKASADYRAKHKPAKKKVSGIGKGTKPTGRPTNPAPQPRPGTGKGSNFFKPIAGTRKKKRKAAAGKKHTDTRSHNVNIRVLSGRKKMGSAAPENFTRINNDVNGNPRYVIHWLNIADSYPAALRIAKKVGGKKFHNKQYGGGIVFQSYSLPETSAAINRAIADSKKVGSTLLLERGESARKKPNRILQIKRTKAGTFKKFSSVGALPMYKDPTAVQEILLVGENDADLYRRRREPILKNLYKKWKKGLYNTDRAAKLWLYYVNDADKMYNKEYVNRKAPGYLLSISDRRLAALELAKETLKEFESGSLSFSMTT